MLKNTSVAVYLLAAFFLLQGFFDIQTEPIKTIKAQFENGLEQLDESLNAYSEAADRLDTTSAAVAALQKAHLEARLAYKTVEYLIEYIDPQAAKKSLNGAPLPYPEPAAPKLIELQPVGLQVLDDLIFGETPFENKTDIKRLIANLRADMHALRPQLVAQPLTHRHIFEAARRELVRIFTLGVTGFDTPGSANALPEARAAFTGLEQAIRCYLPLLDAQDRGLAIVLDARLSYTADYLRQPHGFEDFDRLNFLTQHINPLYEILYHAHRKLGIETIDEVEKLPQAVNYHATGIFDSAFLNAGYFAAMKMDAPGMDKRVALGRLLFFDPVLSSDNRSSCASCHQPEKAFTDGLEKSLARDGKHTVRRNAPTLLNSVYSEHYFHDLREPGLDRQILHVVRDSNEFATDYVQITNKLSLSSEYRKYFLEAYPEVRHQPVSAYTISNALAAYVASLNSFDSPFDQYATGKTGVIAPEVARGFNLFMGKAACGTCHFAPVFNGTVPPVYTESESEVLGVPVSAAPNAPVDPDLGRFDNLKPRDAASFYRHSFKTPTVRNAALTAPYMHNGVYKTLEEVVDFYNKGGGQGLGIVLEHQTLPFDNLQLTPQEQKDLVSFMNALTDSNLQRFSVPDKLPEFDQKPEWNARLRK
jgi:cytochrome c peroxidase